MDVLASYGSDSDDGEVSKDTASEETNSHLSSDLSINDLKSKHQLQIAPIVPDKKVLFHLFLPFINQQNNVAQKLVSTISCL